MLKRSVLSAALAASLAMVACGGSDSEDSPQPGPGPGPAPTGDRIEPLDTATLPRSGQAKAAPEAVSRLPAGAAVPQVSLGALPAAPKQGAADKNGALQIGVGRDVPATAAGADLARQLQWSTLGDGSRVAAVAFAAEGAQAVRLGVLAQAVPAGTVLRFYGERGSPVAEVSADDIAQLREVNEAGGVRGDAARMVWGPETEGPVGTLEVQLPAGVAVEHLQLAVPQLSHLTQTVAQAIVAPAKDYGDSGSCNIDAMCSAYEAEGRSVAKMAYVKDGNSYLCTGTLLNDTRNSQTPYFLTAAHCISDQAAASTLNTYWFYRSATCDSARMDAQATRLGGGAQLLYANARIDTTLLQLREKAPANVVYAGSYFGTGVAPGADVLGLHHPSGDWMKLSIGSITGYGSCRDSASGGSCTDGNEANGPMFKVRWRLGITEGGSSGSAIFAQTNDTRYVIGALFGGRSSCQNPSGEDFYGRFQWSFADGINRWLTR